MSELRHDPVQRRWIIVATERGRRPTDFQKTKEEPVSGFCPFCPGNEDKTPPEIFAFRESGTQPNKPGWLVRVIPNKYPALTIEGELGRKGVGLYDMMNGVGAHEVILETPEHNLHMADMPIDQLVKVLISYRERIADLMKDYRFRYILVFKNYGSVAGASLSHPHTQLIATPITPRTVAIELESALLHYRNKERCLFCDVLSQEIDTGSRIIRSDDRYVAYCPYASRFPFETFILPRPHRHSFALITDEEIHSLAFVLKDVLSRLKYVLEDPPYNFVIHTTPNVNMKPKRPGYWQTVEFDYHWHIEIIPRLTKMAGFEWGTGFYINPTPPELAAKYLREAEITM